MVDRNFRGNVPGLFLYLGDTPARPNANKNMPNPGGVAPAPNVAGSGWSLCQDSYCTAMLANGSLTGEYSLCVIHTRVHWSLCVITPRTRRRAGGNVAFGEPGGDAWLRNRPVQPVCVYSAQS